MIDSYTLYNVCAYLLILTSYSVSPRGAATEGVVGYVPPPTLKSIGTSYGPPPTFTTTFILIGWSPLHTKSFQLS